MAVLLVCTVILLLGLVAPSLQAQTEDNGGPSSTFCTIQEGIFASRFSQTYLMVGSLVSLLLLPFILPLMFGYRFWWTTRPVLRWALTAGFSWTAFLVPGTVIPQLALAGSIPPDLFNLGYGTSDPGYLDCVGVAVTSPGVLWGLFGDPEQVILGQDGARWLGVMAMTLAGAGIYWAAYLLWHNFAGGPSWHRKAR